MHRSFYFLSMCFLLQGCESPIEDVHNFVASIKTTKGMTLDPLPKPSPYYHYEYDAAHIRSPFDVKQSELISNAMNNQHDCLQPNFKRRKSLLEAHALDNLVMRGTLSASKEFWALVQTNTGDVYKVKKGDYIGLFHGRITKVNEQKIELTEILADGSDCWIKRKNSLLLELDV